jgi:hypothetical protein
MTIHNKGKHASMKPKYTKVDYERMLRWKLGVKGFKNEAKGQKIDALKILWEQYIYFPIEYRRHEVWHVISCGLYCQ